MKRFILGFLCAISLAMTVPACGGDDDGDSAGADAASGFEAAAFCTMYGTTCGFTDWYDSQESCVTSVTAWGADRQACISEHLGFAAGEAEGSAERMMHCGHAGGEAPCN